MSERDRIEDAARVLAEGGTVDWEAMEQQIDSDQERRWLRNLQMVQRMAAAHHDVDDTVEVAGTATPHHLDPGHTPTLKVWGHLNLLERLGRGGFGEVYRAWDTRLNRPVALKLLHRETDAHGVTDEDRVLEEARLLARVEHPNVARVYGVERHEGRAGIWMELVEGTDLRTLVLEGRPLEPVDAARLARDVAEALVAVHGADVVHQDVKPQNVVVREDGRVVLMDFGAGRRRRFDSDEGPRLVAGSPPYLAPEVLLRDDPPSPSSDVYALGATLFFLLTGRHPVEGDLGRICAAHRDGQIQRLDMLRPEVPASLRGVVDQALAPRDQRYANATALRDALDVFLAASEPAAGRQARWPLVLAAALVGVVLLGLALQRMNASVSPISAQVQMAALNEGRWSPLALNDAIGPGDGVELQVQLNRPAHVYVLNRDAAGHAVVLFPMRGGDKQNPLPEGRPITLPGMVEGKRMAWEFSDVTGAEDFLVIASATPLREFETQLAQYAAVDAGGGLTVQPIDGAALEVAFRGVIGMVERENPASSQGDLFELADAMAEGAEQLWMQRLRLQNTGR